MSNQNTPEKNPAVLSHNTAISQQEAPRPLSHSSSYSYGYFSGNKERPLREYIAIIIHYRLLIICFTIIGAITGYYHNSKVQFEFTGEALVSIGSYLPPTDGPVAAALQIESSKQDYVANLLHLIMSYRIAQYVYLKDEKIWRHFNPVDPAPKSEVTVVDNKETEQMTLSRSIMDEKLAATIPVPMLEAYLGKISYTQVDGGSLVRIYARASDPEIAAYIANKHAAAFIDLVREQRRQTAVVNVDFLNRRVSELSQKTTEAQTKMEEFARVNDISPATGAAIEGGDLHGIVANLSSATAEKALLEQEVRDLRPSKSIDNMALDNEVVPLISKLTELESEYKALSAINSTHPMLRTMRSQMDNLKKVIRFTADQKRKDSEMKRKAVTAKESLLRSEYKRLREQESTDGQNRMKYSMMEKEYQTLKIALEEVQKRLEDAVIQAESDQQTAQVVDPAVQPMYPSRAPRNSNILTTALIGLFVGIGLAFLLDSQDGTIRTLTDLRQTLDLPILGIIPAFSKKLLSNREHGKIQRIDDDDEFHSLESELIQLSEVKAFSEAIHALYDRAVEEQQSGAGPLSAERHPVVIMSAPFSREAEAFRNLRTTILFSRAHATPKKILFTSAQKGVGKTTVAVNVAASISQTGVKVVLVDADLRMPTVHEHFGLNRFRIGLSDYLEGNAELPEAIVESGIPSLSLLLAGSPSQNPSELLSSPPMIELLGILEKQYDLVIIDTPPVGEIADALLLAHIVDGVIKVIRSGVSLKNSAKLTDTRLRQVNAKILGVAFNGVSNLSSFREGYEYYYSKYGSYGYHGYHSYHSPPGYHAPPPKAPKVTKDKANAEEDSLIM